MSSSIKGKGIQALIWVMVVLAAAWAVGAGRDRYEVAKMTKQMKTLCVGRMLIDLPMEAKTVLNRASIDGFDIDAFAESTEAFNNRVAAREAELQAKPAQHGEAKNLESVRMVNNESGLMGKIFVHGRNVEETTAGYSADTFQRIRYEGVDLEAHVHGNGISVDVSAKDYDPDLIANLPKLVGQLVANPENRIPTEPGFCLDKVFVLDPLTADQGEQIILWASLPSRPDIDIRFETFAGKQPANKGLLERNAASHARAPAIINMRFTNLRAAPRTIGGLTGDELGERVVEENFSIIYGFQWEVLGTEDNVFMPELTLEMATGRSRHGPVQSSLSQLAALALWDQISSTVRVRPTTTSKATAAAPPYPSLGDLASAGDMCPQSGWWQCTEGGDGAKVLGGRRQFLRQGQRVPQALLLPPPTLWQKVRGVQPTLESDSPTTWKLVDKRNGPRATPRVPLDPAKIDAPFDEETAPPFVEQASIGACANSGSLCPVSGWWRCEDRHAADGTRWFGQGSLLPAATFLVSPHSAGTPGPATKLIHRRTTWRLVRIAKAPGSAEPI